MQESGTLYIVSTPIGNLADLSARAREVLGTVDRIACEDTRHSGRLLNHLGIRSRLVSLHDHNEERRLPGLVSALEAGESIAVISDAGTPLVSDPGFRLVRAAAKAGCRISPIPGPSAVIAALSVSGLPPEPFAFEGFPPRQAKARREGFRGLRSEPRTLVFYESIHRLGATLSDMAAAFGADRSACVCRELTKRNEQIRRDTLAELAEWAASAPEARKGEAVILVGPAERSPEDGGGIAADDLLAALARRLPPGEAASLVSELTGQPRRRFYQRLLDRNE